MKVFKGGLVCLILLFSAVHGSFEESYHDAEALFQSGQYTEAQKAYDSLLKKYKKLGYESEMRMRIAECKFNILDLKKKRKA